MTCNEIENRLPAYLENFLSPEEKKSIEGHLASCPSCRRASDALRKAEGIVQDLTEVEPPPFLEQRIMSRVREEAAPEQGILRKLFYPLYIKVPIQAFATLMVAVIAFSIYRTVMPELNDSAPPAMTLTEPAKDRVAAESRKAPVAPSAVTPMMRTPAGDLPEKKQQRLIAPAIENDTKADRVSGSPSPLQEERALAMKSAAPAMATGERKSLLLPAETLSKAQEGAGKQEAGPSFETALPKHRRKGEMTPVGAAPDPSQVTAAVAVKRSVLDLAIYVKDARVAVRDVEEHLGRINGRIIERHRRDEKEFLKADVAAQDLAAFLDRIEAIGRVKVKKSPRDVPDGPVTINMEIANEP
ncbi:MAG: anti-sigma factor [Pseudomonadota bacterium]